MKGVSLLLVSEEYRIQQMLLKSIFFQQLSCYFKDGYSMILIQTEENRNRVIHPENPILYAYSLRKLAFSSNIQKITRLRPCSVFSPELAFVCIHHL